MQQQQQQQQHAAECCMLPHALTQICWPKLATTSSPFLAQASKPGLVKGSSARLGSCAFLLCGFAASLAN